MGSDASLLIAARLRVWGERSVLSLLDQGLTSGANFAANLLLARWMGANLYGAFALAFAGYLLVTGFHNVLFLEPMTVHGASRYREDVGEYFAAMLRAHVIVVGTLSVVVSLVGGIWWARGFGGPLGPLIVAVGVSLPFLLILWMARRMCYVVRNPRLAAGTSGFYLVLLVSGMFALRKFGWIGPARTFLLMAGTSLCASLLVFHSLSIPLQVRRCMAHPIGKLLGENWQYGRWLTLTNALSWMTVQAQAFIVGATLGLAGAGALRAMQLPSLLMTQVIVATTLLVLPSLSQELGKGNIKRVREMAVTSSTLLAIGGISFTSVLFLVGPALERLLFSGKYSSTAWLIPVLALVPVFTGFSSCLSFVLRMCGRTKYELFAYAVSSVTAVVLAIALMPRWGLTGAAASIVASTAVLSVAVWICYAKVGWPEARQGRAAEERRGGVAGRDIRLWSKTMSSQPTATFKDSPSNENAKACYGETTLSYVELPATEKQLRSFRFVRPWLGSLPVLDLGCAKGAYLRQLGPGSVGADVSRPNLQHCRRLGLNVREADLNQELPFPAESFPAVLCSHVLEHVDAPISLLRECHRVLQHEGLLVLGLPIENSLVNRVRGQKYFYHHAGHLYSFSLENIDVLLKKTGFRIERFYFEPRILYFSAWEHLLQRLSSGIAYTLALVYWVVARKQLEAHARVHDGG